MVTLSNKLDEQLTEQNLVTDNQLSQASTVAIGEKFITDGMPELARKAAADGIVLLENSGILPFAKGTRLSVFGRCQMDTFYVGYGSGGDVKPPYKVSYMDALLEAEEAGEIFLNHDLIDLYNQWRSIPDNEPKDGYWGNWPMCYQEMPVTEEQAQHAAKFGELAMVIIGRAAGEDRENKLEAGSYYLNKDEETMLRSVTSAFGQVVVVLDCGNVIDLAWLDEYKDKITTVIYAWQGGMETGHGLVDILTGKVNPSAKLTDTISLTYEDQPTTQNFGAEKYNNYVEDIFVGYRYFETFAADKVRYPFGYGLSYTSFTIEPLEFDYDRSNGIIKTNVRVTNTGNMAGREVAQLYVEAPQGFLGKAKRSLVSFAKTKLLQVGESEELLLECKEYDFASYDDSGATGHKHSYVLEEGTYNFHVGNSVRDTVLAASFVLEDLLLLHELQSVCGVVDGFQRLHATEVDGKIQKTLEEVPEMDYDLKERILNNLPKDITVTGDRGIKLVDVVDGKHTLDEFIAQLSDEELEGLTRGYGEMDAPHGTAGNAGAFGGIIPELEEKGIRPVITTDGPGGIRINGYASLLPCGTALASSWDIELVETIYKLLATEMDFYKTDIILGAGMNIHRNPLCGRNFEYFSEDPLLTGKMGVAFTKGIQSLSHKGACPKHLACNNQEVCRNTNDSRVSERALREIYLKGFEIVVKESSPVSIMTSYNKINGVWSHYNYDLVTTVLRDEWGYEGLVMTDWWMQAAESPEFPMLKDNAYRVRAQVDILMPGMLGRDEKGYVVDGSLLATIDQPDGIKRSELQRTAKTTLQCVMKLKY